MKSRDILPRIYKYCAYQDRSRQEIEEKLKSLEVEPSDFEEIFEQLKLDRMWDEARYARSFTRGKFTVKKWGRTKIRHELKKKGVSSALIEEAFRSEIEEEDYQKIMAGLIEKKKNQWAALSAFESKQKIIRFLQQKGYEWDSIMQVLN
ncbi:MAG: regulatory protein RecX [Bacteroidota bacterium]